MTITQSAELATVLAQLMQILDAREPERPTHLETQTMPERVLLTVEEAAKQLGIGRTLMFRLVKAGEVASVTIGRLRRVPASAVRDYAASLVTHHNAA